MQVYALVIDEVAREKKSSISGQMSLFDLIPEEEKQQYETRLPDVPDFSKQERLLMEKEMLGIYISGHPLEDYMGLWRSHITKRVSDFLLDEETGEAGVQDGEKVVIGGMITGGLIGLVNGFFNVKRQISSFIVTICNMYLFRGVCAYLTTKSPVYGVSDISKYNTLPFMLTFTIVIFVAAWIVFTFTGLGSRLKAIGAGEIAARFAGIRVERMKILVYMAAGCITGLAAFVNSVKVGSVTSTAGSNLETQIMISLVLGGMPINGGAKVRFYNIILGVMTYKVLSGGLVMLMIPTQLQQLILGVIFLAEVALFSDRNTGMIVK
jgi:ribose/xylose/arabinose/galactoside ABC-type transport system permease subunit